MTEELRANLAKEAKWLYVEMAVEQMWRNRRLGDYPAAMAATLAALPGWIRGPVHDPWAPGGRIDLYLTDTARSEAANIATSDAGTSAKAELLRLQGNEAGAFAQWQRVFGNQFPAYG